MATRKLSRPVIVELNHNQLASLNWNTPPQSRGQTVVYSYAGSEMGVFEMINDRSDGEITFRLRAWRDDDEDTPGLNFRPKGFLG